MPMYWTCIELLTVLYIVILNFVVTFKYWILTSEKKDQVARIGVRGGLGDSGNARKKTFFSTEAFPYYDYLLFLV